MPETAPPPTDAARPLESFTDEELAILAGTDGIVVSPFLDRIGAEHRATAERTAYRSLLARGIVDPPAPDALANANDGAVDLPVREDVHALITLRGSAAGVVAIARTGSQVQDFWYAHIASDVALVEQVGEDGIHRFAVLDIAGLPDAVVEAAVHPETGDATGYSLHLYAADAQPPPEVLTALGEAFVRSDVVIRVAGDSGQPELTGVFTGPKGAWMFRGRFGSGADLVLVPCTAAGLRGVLRARVGEALARLQKTQADTGAKGGGS